MKEMGYQSWGADGYRLAGGGAALRLLVSGLDSGVGGSASH